MTLDSRVPAACPVCGAHSLSPEGHSSALLAVCDVLVVKALEKIGNRIVKGAPRREGRHHTLGDRPWHTAHTVWPAEEDLVAKTLRGAWDVVPAMLDTHGCCGITSWQVTEMLDSYVRDLVITGTVHEFTELLYRFETRLGLPVYARETSDAH